MTSACPYCGAARKFNFCVVCGRKSTINKMGNLRSVARNTDETQRLEDPLHPKHEDHDPQKALRFRNNFRSFLDAILGGIIVGALMFCLIKEAINLYTTDSVKNMLAPWMKTRRISVPGLWSIQLPALVPFVAKNNEKSINHKNTKTKKHHYQSHDAKSNGKPEP